MNKLLLLIILLSALLGAEDLATSPPEELNEALLENLVYKQDDLSAEVQEMIELQTQEGVIRKLEEMESSMIEATLNLYGGKTSGETIAIQTEIIEKAYEAAKEKQKSNSDQSDTNKALMDMLEKMLGKSKGKPSDKKSDQSGSKGGKGQEGDGSLLENYSPSDITSSVPIGSRRTVPSASATTGQLLPQEFQELIEDYNR